MAPKKRYDNKFFFTPVYHCCFWIRDPGWVKIRIRDKNPGSATLQKGTGSRIRIRNAADKGVLFSI
jgi:hypothetical protein